MKYVPCAFALTIAGVVGIIAGAANSWGWVITAAGIVTLIGLVWFAHGWADLMNTIIPVKGFSRRVRKIESEARDYRDIRNAADSAINHKLNTIQKQNSQKIKGQVVVKHIAV